MKIFSRIRKKVSHHQPNQESATNHHMMHQTCREEFSDWPNALLAIGTFGNNNLQNSDKSKIRGSLSSPKSQDHPENTTPEDFRETDKALRALLNQHISTDSSFSGELERHYMSLEKYLDGLPKGDETINESEKHVTEEGDSRLHQTSSIVHGREANNVRLNNKRNGIDRSSLSFLLKKAFLRGGGLVVPPSLRDPSPEPIAHSRTDKILRAFMNKKLYPRKSSPKANPKKYLDMHETDGDGEEPNKATEGSKWVKTDTEYIILEM